MADLNSFGEKYNGFKAPVAVVKVNGEKIDREVFAIKNIRVNITSEYKASDCELVIQINNCTYDDDKLGLGGDISTFDLGSTIEISLGYNDEDGASEVFYGIITERHVTYSGIHTVILDIRGMDVKVAMMGNLNSEVTVDAKKYSAAAILLIEKYSAFYKKLSSESSDDIENLRFIQYKESDYDCVVRVAKKLGYLFYVVNGEVIFKKISSLSEEGIEISPCPYLYSFYTSQSIYDLVKTVKIINSKKDGEETPIESSVESGESVGDGSPLVDKLPDGLKSSMKVTLCAHEVLSESEAEQAAKAIHTFSTMKSTKTEVEVSGIPDIKPGTYAKFTKINDNFNKKYFITNVKHETSENRYSTIIECVGNME